MFASYPVALGEAVAASGFHRATSTKAAGGRGEAGTSEGITQEGELRSHRASNSSIKHKNAL